MRSGAFSSGGRAFLWSGSERSDVGRVWLVVCRSMSKRKDRCSVCLFHVYMGNIGSADCSCDLSIGTACDITNVA